MLDSKNNIFINYKDINYKHIHYILSIADFLFRFLILIFRLFSLLLHFFYALYS